jgi:lysosomal acid phosphatase
MKLSKVLGVIVIVRNGDRFSFHQDPYTYAASDTETTALGEANIILFCRARTVN